MILQSLDWALISQSLLKKERTLFPVDMLVVLIGHHKWNRKSLFLCHPLKQERSTIPMDTIENGPAILIMEQINGLKILNQLLRRTLAAMMMLKKLPKF
jgi:hypothetical protein